MFYTYLYEDIDGTPIYVGKGKEGRAYVHRTKKTKLGNTIRKRARDGHQLQPKITVEYSENAAKAIEIFWIAAYGRENLGTGPLFNLTDGGEGTSGIVQSTETRAKRAASLRGKECKPETRALIGAKNKGNTAGQGKICAESTKQSISKANSRPKTEAEKVAMSEAAKKRKPRTPDQRAALGQAQKARRERERSARLGTNP
jgi:hypothetical protein